MRTATRHALRAAILAAGLWTGAAEAAAQVTFTNVSAYADSTAREPATLAEFRRLIERLARKLPAGQDLSVTISDVRLAGMVNPFTGSDVRIQTGATPPRFVLSYRLTKGGRTLAADTVTLIDTNYQMNPDPRVASGRFPYETALLTDWFNRTFLKRPW